jgi:hypothetical protein
MKTTKETKSALYGLSGVLLGSLLTGIFALITTQKQHDIQREQITSNNLSVESERFISVINKQIELFEFWDDKMSRYEYLVLSNQNTKLLKWKSKVNMLDWTSELMTNSYKIFLISDYEFGKLTISLRDSLITTSDSLVSTSKRPFYERIDQHDNRGLQFEEWLFRAKLELLKNNKLLTPIRLKEEERKILSDKLKIYKNKAH